MKIFEQKIMSCEMNNRAKLIALQEKIRSNKQKIDIQKKMGQTSLFKTKEGDKELDNLISEYQNKVTENESVRFIEGTYDFENFDGKFSILNKKPKLDIYCYISNPYYRGIYKVSKKYYECLNNLSIDNIDNFNTRFKNEILIGIYSDKSISQILDSSSFLETSSKYFK